MRELLERVPVVPVVVIEDAADAVPLAYERVAGLAAEAVAIAKEVRG